MMLLSSKRLFIGIELVLIKVFYKHIRSELEKRRIKQQEKEYKEIMCQ